MIKHYFKSNTARKRFDDSNNDVESFQKNLLK